MVLSIELENLMKTLQKLFVLSLFVAGSVLMVGGCGDQNKKATEKPATKASDEPEKKAGDAPDNASTTPAADGVTKVVFKVSGMS